MFLQNIAKIVITWTEEKVMLNGPLKHVFWSSQQVIFFLTKIAEVNLRFWTMFSFGENLLLLLLDIRLRAIHANPFRDSVWLQSLWMLVCFSFTQPLRCNPLRFQPKSGAFTKTLPLKWLLNSPKFLLPLLLSDTFKQFCVFKKYFSRSSKWSQLEMMV